MVPMNDRSMPALSRRPAAWLLAFLVALAPFAGCECPSTLPVVPVLLPPLSAVVVTPGRDTLRVGETAQFAAIAYDTLGQPVAGASFTWSSGDAAVFSVNSFGRVTGVAEGVDTVFAQVGGRTGIAIVFVYRDTGWVAQASGTKRNLNGVYFLGDGRTGWAVGSGGAIVRTTDAGQRWSTQPSGTAFNLNAVWFTSLGEGWVVGNVGTVLHTMNAGSTWTRLMVPAGENLMDICFANPDAGWAVGSSGLVLRTVDGGASWQRSTLTTTVLQSVSFAGTQDGWLVGDGGEIFGTQDAGVSWSRVQPSITTQSLKAVSRRRAEAAWAVGDRGVAPRTVGSPAAYGWELRNTGALNQLDGVHFPDDLIGYAVGFNGAGAILRTDDAGVIWQAQGARSSLRLNDVFFVDALRGWAVGDGGTIVHTALGGRN
jgi:photosystem II stability/assembly factor-like uncharacterized protein